MKKFHVLATAVALLLALPTISMAESDACGWGKTHSKHGEMKHADTNGDCKIDQKEYMEAAKKRFARMDVNHDGILDKKDHMAFFDRIDSNHDGSLSREEFKSAHAKRHKAYKK